MSIASVNNVIRDGLKYKKLECGCGWRASIKISESSLNKNKLYYCCAANQCGLFSWCLPFNQRADEVSQATGFKSGVDASQLLMDLHELWADMRGKHDMVQLVHRNDIESMKKLVTIGLVVILGLIVVLWYQI